jgi:hypothetical protein
MTERGILDKEKHIKTMCWCRPIESNVKKRKCVMSGPSGRISRLEAALACTVRLPIGSRAKRVFSCRIGKILERLAARSVAMRCNPVPTRASATFDSADQARIGELEAD